MDTMIENILKTLTLEEKAKLCSGEGLWQTKPLEEKGIPTIWMADGSNGIRIMKPVKNSRKQDTSDFLNVTDLTQGSPSITNQHEAVCYPCGAALASTWDADLIEKMGKMLGDECRYRKINLLLAPGINIKRSPLGGRGYEYYSEDPYLTGKIAESFIKGVQKTGVGTSVKHFAANNAETLRINMSSEVSERALREIYLAPFEMAVKNANPWTVMSSYNKVNGVQMAENKYLLTDILRDEWGFDGAVISDWGGVKDRVKALIAGNDLDMPENQRNDKSIIEAVENGSLSEEVLNKSVKRILELIFKAKKNENFTDTINWEAHRNISREVASDSIILLKNENNILPITKEKYKKVAVVGSFAESPRYQGGGCTLVNPTHISSPYEEICRLADNEMEISYAQGYELKNTTSAEMLAQAVNIAKNADVAIVFAGLWVAYDREGFDRKHLHIDSSHTQLINEIIKVQKNVVVVLSNGDAVTMDPWLPKVDGVIEQFLIGETIGESVADVLFGIVNPSGKLPVTFPRRLEDTSAYPYFPGECGQHMYGEGIYVGYRYYEKKKIEPLFPFGYGLSYTSFEYSNLILEKKSMDASDSLNVQCTIKNTGFVKGKEIVQLYVTDEVSRLQRPEKELKAFCKVELLPSESKTIRFQLDPRAFSYYDPEVGDWVIENGVFTIQIAKSSQNVVLKDNITVVNAPQRYRKLYLDSQHTQVLEHPLARKMYEQFLIEKGITTPEKVDTLIPLLKSNYMGIYNVLTSLLGANISKEELQKFIDDINERCS